jgi:hypothetical protein
MAAQARIPRSAWVVALSAATLGVIYGYDGSNVAGAQLYFETYFGLQNDETAVETIVTATVYGELIGALGAASSSAGSDASRRSSPWPSAT